MGPKQLLQSWAPSFDGHKVVRCEPKISGLGGAVNGPYVEQTNVAPLDASNARGRGFSEQLTTVGSDPAFLLSVTSCKFLSRTLYFRSNPAQHCNTAYCTLRRKDGLRCADQVILPFHRSQRLLDVVYAPSTLTTYAVAQHPV